MVELKGEGVAGCRFIHEIKCFLGSNSVYVFFRLDFSLFFLLDLFPFHFFLFFIFALSFSYPCDIEKNQGGNSCAANAREASVGLKAHFSLGYGGQLQLVCQRSKTR